MRGGSKSSDNSKKEETYWIVGRSSVREEFMTSLMNSYMLLLNQWLLLIMYVEVSGNDLDTYSIVKILIYNPATM